MGLELERFSSFSFSVLSSVYSFALLSLKELEYRPTSFNCALLCFASQILPLKKKTSLRFEAALHGVSFGTIFLTAFAPFMSLCHILVIHMTFQIFSLVLCLLW